MNYLYSICLLIFPLITVAQPCYWQQEVDYTMDVVMNTEDHRYRGTQTLVYSNNSPDTLTRVFYHLYFNAFQPGSMMDIRSQNIVDADRRVRDRISTLEPEERGFLTIDWLKQDGADLAIDEQGTILEATLAEPLLPGEQAKFEMEFHGQVPVHIRRAGRNNTEGVAYSMAQWYPKLCEYDEDGWHPNPYVGREFYGVWGDYDVTITIDKEYILGATGYLENPEEIGCGYRGFTEPTSPQPGKTKSWRFIAPMVHDFVWSADQDYKHVEYEREDGLVMHFLYQETEDNKDAWGALPEVMDVVFDYLNENFGEYPYEQYSFLQAGDGGMEYPMATFITGNRPYQSLVGVSVHELVHSWYQMILATNESLYPWMDEGFTSYTSSEIMNELARQGLLPGRPYSENPHKSSYQSYATFSTSGYEEPLSTHADHFQTNTAYGVGSYTKGSIFLHQLEYIIGEEAFRKTLLRYYEDWKFKHPDADDFIRVAEKCSGMVLDWYKEYWINTTHTIDYGIESVEKDGSNTVIKLQRVGLMPMPVELVVTESNGDEHTYYMPLRIMRGSKAEAQADDWTIMEAWPWTHPTYTLEIPLKTKKIESIAIDPSYQMMDVNLENNVITAESIKS